MSTETVDSPADETANFVLDGDKPDAPNINESELSVGDNLEPPKIAEEENEDSAQDEQVEDVKAEQSDDKSKAEESNDDEKSGDDETASQPKGRASKRIKSLIKQRSEKNAQLEEARAENARLKEQLEQKKQSEADELVKPDEDDFDSYDEYLDAEDEYKAKVREQRSSKQTESTEENTDGLTTAQQDALNDIKLNIEEAESLPDDFADTVTNNEKLALNGEIAELIASCENPVDVLYTLGKDTARSQEIALMAPAKQGMAIKALDKKASMPTKKAQVSKAPPPIKTVSGGDASQKSINDMSVSEYNAYRDSQERKSSLFW